MKLSIAKAIGVTVALAGLSGGAIAAATTANGATTSGAGTTASAVTTASVPALDAGKLSFVRQGWSKSGVARTGTEVPKGWTKALLSWDEAQFRSPNGVWNLRVHGFRGHHQPPQTTAAAVNAKIKALKGKNNFRVLSIVTGVTKTMVLHGQAYNTRTMTYTYTDAKGNTRLVIDRFFNGSGVGSNIASDEIAAAGRVQDRVGLHKLVDRATGAFYVVG
ncbi:hypothetical protein [Kribbella deserti]|uniref:Lipoprotein n=1 Tax=Kribbella deserti TaxID=1926257 RepID=A0ABV6QKX9_9ACTN